MNRCEECKYFGEELYKRKIDNKPMCRCTKYDSVYEECTPTAIACSKFRYKKESEEE